MYYPKVHEILIKEALTTPQIWTECGSYKNWHDYVGENVRMLWNSFTDEQKVAIAADAAEFGDGDRQEWDGQIRD